MANSNIRILESSLPAVEETESHAFLHTGRPLLRNKRLSPLSEKPNPLTPAHATGRPASPGPNSLSSTKKSKVRWHFGIRSRSEPLEVMLEIYRTLKTLGFEWRAKDPEKRIDMDDYADDRFQAEHDAEYERDREHRGRERERENGGYDREREREEAARRRNQKRKEEEEFLKKAQALFFIETRCKMDDVIVRMDLQLYSIDSENYLVDFRNLGYKLVKGSPKFNGGDSRNSYEDLNAARLAHQQAGSGTRSPNQSQTEKTVGQTVLPPGAQLSLSELGQVPPILDAGTGTPSSSQIPPTSPHRSYSSSRRPSQDPNMPAVDADATSRQLWEAAAKARALTSSTGGRGQDKRPGMRRQSSHHSSHFGQGGVSSPFLFLECACRLIVELGGSIKERAYCARNQNSSLTIAPLSLPVYTAVGSG